MQPDVTVRPTASPADDEVRAVLALADAARAHDDVHPLDEATRLRLRATVPADGVVHLLAASGGGTVLGYAQLVGSGTADAEISLVVHPDARRAGLGRSLLARVTDLTGTAVRGWAHGDLPGARGLAAAEGFEAVRGLWRMTRDMAQPLTQRPLPDGVRIRSFEPGRDEQAWLAVNARAFATHPEQGRWTLDDLTTRQGEPWFDPQGFLLAVDAETGDLLGYHWTKVQDGVGEVYVVGVDPRAQGRRLGTSLTLAGLHHLAAQGVPVVELYVESDNEPALAVYRGMGFERAAVDVMYARA